MKFRSLLIGMLCCAAAASAQNPYISPIGVVEQAGSLTAVQPRTLLAVDLTVEKETILCGPYARYAQKLLGVRAPLTDKTNYRLVDASVGLLADESYLYAAERPETKVVAANYAGSAEEFARIQPDKTDMSVVAPETAAQEAAKTLFALRKHRMELITGEAGEHVFGEGLKAALDEIARLEQSYLELFLGKQVVTTHTTRFLFMPQRNQRQYPVCRFSASEGLLSDNASTGDAVKLAIAPSGYTESELENTSKDKSVVMPFRVADPSSCTVTCGDEELTRVTLPIFEYGRTIQVALPR